MDIVERQKKIEVLADDILTDKQLSIDYDRKRQETREAINKLRQQTKNVRPGSRLATTTINMGDFFLDMPAAKAQGMVEGAQKELDGAIDDVRQRLKKKVELLAQLEGDERKESIARSMNLKATN
ncbi:hypothetical protein IW140_001340 [Coemansia sp. RSA 1813]|nr:hypothetical protein EV178_000984 [Coemansia sp. RSA 1646]KAJ1769141.1 hypothetical protein LPJ74_004312 [Coemansia sp. RSA 1843]KAJ2091906.1 hypothetical protein IW138_001595 [Coemansia sp. RSA 986]KAJ2212468.1 hypothetical protein EV179_004650 [Coemansia sp. RSA 487]KAJ2571699.1 hypothetical protein IW140_001340 [Coemansia sp. RSA 1813]